MTPTFDPKTTAVAVIDVQNDFCAAGGYFARSGADMTLVDPGIDRLVTFLDSARAAGVMVIFVRNHYDPVYLSRTQNARRARAGWDLTLCHQGTWGADFYKVAPQPGEPIVTKHRYDAFYNTDFELILRSNGIETVVFTGVATNTCVETSLRNAFVRDFEVAIVDDCCVARSKRFHDHTLETVGLLFGHVMKAADLEKIWNVETAREASPAMRREKLTT